MTTPETQSWITELRGRLTSPPPERLSPAQVGEDVRRAAVLVPLYVGSWTMIQVLRWFRDPPALKAWLGGWRAGWREDPGERRPLRWRTIWRMARAGRPPVI